MERKARLMAWATMVSHFWDEIMNDCLLMIATALRGEVQPLWVVRYTAVVRNRGVVENKGYFAVAELSD